jgi:PAS domain S-box-containing protein
MTRNLLFVVFILIFKSLIAQYQFKNFNAVIGKRDVQINCIAQDKNGYLWLGTKEGVYKFDGKSGQAIINDKAILNQDISAIFIDGSKTIWMGSKSGKVYYFRNNRLDSINFSKYPNSERITSFCEVSSKICIGTYGNGLYTYSKKQLAHYNTDNGLKDNVVYKIIADNIGVIWCGTDGGIIRVADIFAQPKFSNISNGNGLPDNIVRDISFKNNRLLISMQDSGLCFYYPSSNRIEHIPYFYHWAGGAIINAFEMSNNNITMATENGNVVEIETGRKANFSFSISENSEKIQMLFIDHLNQLWVASSKGLNQLFERRYHFINNVNGLLDDKVLATAVDEQNFIWVGTKHSIYKIIKNIEGKYIIKKIQDIAKHTIACAAKSPNGDIWFGTYGSGIIVINPVSEASKILTAKDNNLPNDNISHIYFADNGMVYISTLGGGLGIANAKSKSDAIKVEKIYTEEDGLGSGYVYAAILDKQSKLFIATDGGGIQVLENNKFVSLTNKYKINSNAAFSLCCDNDNVIWATTSANGIIKYDGRSIITINQTNGLRDLQPQQLIATEEEILAINTKGIDKINRKSNHVSYFDVFDGDLEPSLNAIFLNKNNIYCGTNNGVLVYRTKRMPVDTIQPTVFLTQLQVNYKPINKDSINDFKYDLNNFSFEFDGVWLKNPDKLKYKYMLLEFDKDWIYAEDNKIVHYYNLNPGDYKFILHSKNEEDIWSQSVTYNFTIHSPVWKRWWFWVLLFGAVGIGFYLIFRYRIKSLKRKNLLLEQRVNERTHKIEQQSKIIEIKSVELEQLSLVASKTDNVVLILNPDGRLEYVNESFVRVNGMTKEQIMQAYGETIYEFSSYPNIRSIIEEAVNSKRSVNYESSIKGEKINENWYSSTLTPIFDEQNKLKKIIIIDADISERKKQEQIIYRKNKDITDSISYARKIQHAILPKEEAIQSYLPNSFILYLTKDIVSGDFYWFAHTNECSIIAAVDCTGHGVPGAFLSLIGYNILNSIVNEKNITDPKDILSELNKSILEALYNTDSESMDGMDIAICKINHNDKILQYAGAMRPLWIINKGCIRAIDPDKTPIGTRYMSENREVVYHTHTVQVQPGDSIYIFTDGYTDQFGGPRNKKYSSGKFKELLCQNAHLDFNTQKENYRNEHLKWKGDYEQIDDILVIGFSL